MNKLSSHKCSAYRTSAGSDGQRSRGKVQRPGGKVQRSGGKVQRSGGKVQRSGGKVQRSEGKVQRSGRKIQRSGRKVQRSGRRWHRRPRCRGRVLLGDGFGWHRRLRCRGRALRGEDFVVGASGGGVSPDGPWVTSSQGRDAVVQPASGADSKGEIPQVCSFPTALVLVWCVLGCASPGPCSRRHV